MIRREPPKWALWVLEHWGSGYHGESLSGDLFEQYQQGRSPAWYWGQVVAAVLIARGRFIRTTFWRRARRLLARVVAETAAVLAVCAVADHQHRAGSLFGAMTPTFLAVLLSLIAVASAGLVAWIRLGARGRVAGSITALLMAMGVIALGAGTVTWAAAARTDASRSAASRSSATGSDACQSPRN
jgi:hypothetical protein